MKLSLWMTLKSIVCVVFGVLFVVLTQFVLDIFGMSAPASGMVMSRYFGTAFLIIGLLLWLCRNTEDEATKRAFLVSITVGDIIGLVVALLAVLGGLTNAMGWLIVALWLIFALAFGAMLLRRTT